MNLVTRLIIGAGLVAMLVSTAHAATLRPGMPLPDALEALRADGLSIIYSSNLVIPELRLTAVPLTTAPREQLNEILAPFDLRVQAGPGDSLLIVRAEAMPKYGHLTGQVRDAFDGAPLAGAEVILGNDRYRTTTDADGLFLFSELAPGKYRLRVNYEAARYARRERTEVISGEATSVVLEMDGVSTTALDEIVVSTSRYQFGRESIASIADFSAADLEILPNVGDDPLRAIARLPGAATTDFTARTNIRGGNDDENLIRMDGFRLYNPFHFKDFQGLFSAIDPRLVGGMDVYTGGFNTASGDAMSSVMDVHTVQPEDDFYGEVSASFFNLSGLVAQRFNEGRSNWLLSARRGNLEWVFDRLDPTLGNPKYFDIYGRLAHSFSDGLTVTGSVLLIDDNIDIADTDEEEFAQDNYRDSYYWLRFDFAPSDDWSGDLLVARANLESGRGGSVDKEGTTTGQQSAANDFQIDSIETNWSWWFADDWLLQFGGEFRDQEGSFSYSDDALFALLFITPGAPTDPARLNDRAAEVTGRYYALYSNLRTQWTDKLTTELGLRWTRETLSPVNDSSVDPRLGIKYEFTTATRGRFSIGRYSQSQLVNQLDFADGQLSYWPLEKVDQAIISLEHDFNAGFTGRVETYYKDYKDLRPRYENFLDPFTLLPQLWPDRVEVFADEATAKGVELTLSHMDTGPLSWWLTYSWSEVQDRYADTSVLRSWDQQNSLGGGIAWRTSTWELSFAARAHDGWPTTATALDSDGPPALIATGPRNGDRLGTYISLDARIARIWQLSDQNRLTVFFDVHNLSNRKNECCELFETSDEDGEVEYETDVQYQIPFFPSLGFIWQF